MNIRSSSDLGLYVARRNVTRAGRLAPTRSLEFDDEEVSYRVRRWCRRSDGRFRGLRRRQCGEVEILDGCHAKSPITAQSPTDISAQYRHRHWHGHHGHRHWRHRHYRPYYRSYNYYAPRQYGYYGPRYYGGGPGVTFSFGSGGYRGW